MPRRMALRSSCRWQGTRFMLAFEQVTVQDELVWRQVNDDVLVCVRVLSDVDQLNKSLSIRDHMFIAKCLDLEFGDKLLVKLLISWRCENDRTFRDKSPQPAHMVTVTMCYN